MRIVEWDKKKPGKKESIGYSLLLLRLMQSYFLSIVQTPVFVRSKRRMVRKSCSSNSRKNRVYLAGYGLCLLCMRPCANEAMMENAIYASEWKNQFLLLYFFPAEADANFLSNKTASQAGY